jgi:CRP-like cAMP-binding protein
MKFRNTFLSALSPASMTSLLPHLQEVALFCGERLGEAGDAPPSIYFPSNSAISIMTSMQDGREVETASIGYDGVAGLLPALVDGAIASRMCVQIGGGAFSLPAPRFRDAADKDPTLLALALRSVMVSSEQAEQSAACHALHPLTARLARWLLLCQDRVNRSRMDLTQDELGVMASAMRSSISQIASEFKEKGLIRYSRGHMEILNSQGLEKLACECHLHDRARRDALSFANTARHSPHPVAA